jgi:mRNA-degrading endonuclease RelE of RelBE toxin-antitoxin system
MSFKVVPTDGFIKDLKQISKKYKGIIADVAKLSEQLKENPTMGTDLGQNIFKIRISVSGTNKGKSGGARVITCVIVISEVIYLSEIYLKSEHDTVDPNLVVKRLKGEGLI